MKKRKSLGAFPIPTVFALVALFSLIAAAPAYAQETAQAARKDLVLKEDAQCTRCHDEEDAPGLLKIGRTKHGTRADGRTPTCTTCHGESTAHIDVPKGTKTRPKPDRYFTKGTTTPAQVRADTCLGCHAGGEQMFWSSSTHAARDLACNTCHTIHADRDTVRVKTMQTEVCFTCHKKQRVQVTKPSRHPILEGKVTCSDCHNPHGSAGRANLARDTVNDTCFKCHAEKRGPFLWNHQPVTEDCSHCHDPHGTVTASLLKWRVPFLCQQCHEGTSAGTHQGNIPIVGTKGTGGTFGANILMARGCLNCHTNIHGGNNPENSSASRSFRQ
jgi:DmsE family decaheme c-type cytochrome